MKLVEAAKHKQDAVYTWIADQPRETMEDSVKAVIAADLYCHQIFSTRKASHQYKMCPVLLCPAIH